MPPVMVKAVHSVTCPETDLLNKLSEIYSTVNVSCTVLLVSCAQQIMASCYMSGCCGMLWDFLWKENEGRVYLVDASWDIQAPITIKGG